MQTNYTYMNGINICLMFSNLEKYFLNVSKMFLTTHTHTHTNLIDMFDISILIV